MTALDRIKAGARKQLGVNPDWTEQEWAELAVARTLAEHGVPIFLAEPATKAGPGGKGVVWDPTGGHNGCGYWLPKRWQAAKADPAVVDRWRRGLALCAVGGGLLDYIDVDPRNGGDIAALGGVMPRVYGEASTPSGGTHYLVGRLGVAKDNSTLPGIDIQAGVEGASCGFVFLAPTVKLSKIDGTIGVYRWTVEPEADALAGLDMLGTDGTGTGLVEHLRGLGGGRTGAVREVFVYEGPSWVDLPAGRQAAAAAAVEAAVEHWTDRLAYAAEQEEGWRDADGLGWEGLSFRCACSFAALAAAGWSGVDEDQAEALYDSVLPDEMAECCRKWRKGLVGGGGVVAAPPWDDDLDAVPAEQEKLGKTCGANGGRNRKTGKACNSRRNLDADGRCQYHEKEQDVVAPTGSIDVTMPATQFDWIRAELGRGALSGVYLRNGLPVVVPRIDEDGYVKPEDGADDGPAQVWPLTPAGLQTRVEVGYRLVQRTSAGYEDASMPFEMARHALEAAKGRLGTNSLRSFKMVTHTPLLRPDGTVLDEPGYDQSTRVLYLPDPALEQQAVQVPDRPSAAQVRAAAELILEPYSEFAFKDPTHLSNLLGALMIPTLRLLVGPPYPLFGIDAPDRGSGKSYLAETLRVAHGGVLIPSWPTTEEEVGKVIGARLRTTTAPVVTFDNIRGVLRSANLESVATAKEITPRILGESRDETFTNDRLWTFTANNMTIGGDLDRRIFPISIDPGVPDPHLRLGPREGQKWKLHPVKWMQAHRGEVLGAILTLARGWSQAGSPEARSSRSDDYDRLVRVVGGILEWAEMGEGSFGKVSEATTLRSEDLENWGDWLEALVEQFGEGETFSTVQVWEALGDMGGLDPALLPGDLVKDWRSGGGDGAEFRKRLGIWCRFKAGQRAGGWMIRNFPATSKRSGARWAVVRA